jgi:hypothetical protein
VEERIEDWPHPHSRTAGQAGGPGAVCCRARRIGRRSPSSPPDPFSHRPGPPSHR